MAEIWANRLIAGTKQWKDVPSSRKTAVKAALEARVEKGEITQEAMEGIVNAE